MPIKAFITVPRPRARTKLTTAMIKADNGNDQNKTHGKSITSDRNAPPKSPMVPP